MIQDRLLDKTRATQLRGHRGFEPQPDLAAGRRTARSNRTISVTMSIALLVFAGVGAVRLYHHFSPPRHTLAGTFTVWHATPQTEPCADSAAGQRVEVRGADHTLLGRTTLSRGATEVNHRGCVYTFQVPSMSRARTYAIGIGTHVALPYSFTDLQQSRWKVALNLGAEPTP